MRKIHERHSDESESSFILNDFPLPPTVNKLYATAKTGHRFKSREAKEFEHQADIWMLTRRGILNDIRKHFQAKIHSSHWIRVDMYIHLESQKLFTKQGKLKKIDAANRIKPAHDKLSELIGIDDKHFSVGKAEFVLSDRNCILIVLRSSKILSDSDLWALDENQETYLLSDRT